jgi:hypothetical protein
MAKKRGNPNWGKPEVNTIPYTGTSSFEEVVKKLHLSPSQYVRLDSPPRVGAKEQRSEIRAVEPATGVGLGSEGGPLSAWASGDFSVCGLVKCDLGISCKNGEQQELSCVFYCGHQFPAATIRAGASVGS